MAYWLDLFTGETWSEFCSDGARVTGFRERMKGPSNKVKSGDILLCYLTGVSRWVGALEVVGVSSDTRRIWKSSEFPVRFDVSPIVTLAPEHGIPMSELEGKVTFYSLPADRGKFKGFIRMSPNRFQSDADAELILSLLRSAQKSPIVRPVDPKKLAYKPFYRTEQKQGKQTVSKVVSVPEKEDGGKPDELATESTTRHTEVQYQLLSLGVEMGFDVWVARNDRSRKWQGKTLGGFPRSLQELPTQFNEATNRTIELIDVLWLKGNSIVAAFEIECTTSVYSGLLRMSDLLALQPNLAINLFLVAPDERRDKVEQEILRPTFSLRERPLAEICGFLGFDTFLKRLKAIRELGIASSLKADFIEKTAEYFKTHRV